MAFDFKKEYPEYYLPPREPRIVEIAPMNAVGVSGEGDPNDENGAYKQAIGMLYAVAFTIRMSARAGHPIDGFFEYVVPPLEGFWEMEGIDGIDYSRKADFRWTSFIRLPDFVTEETFRWAVETAEKKKGVDLSPAVFLRYSEGLCVQCMHLGPFDDEPRTVALMDRFAVENGYRTDFGPARRHHEIYLSDPRKCAPEKLRTVIRHPIAPLK